MQFKLEKPFDRKITSIKYRLDVGIENFKKIMDRDAEGEELLYEWLEAIESVLHIDYDGHYGPYIFIEVEDTRGMDLNFWYQIQHLIDMFIL